MNLPLVSIVIPMYNQQPEFLRECLRGAIGQTYSNIEVIVSDNYSSEETVRVLEEFSSSRLKKIKPPVHLGIIEHFSFAAEAATGEYISFLSTDDMLYPECIAKVVQPMLENKDIVFSYCESAVIDGTGKQQSILRKLQLPSGIYPRKEIAMRQYLKPEYWIIGGVIRHEHFKKVGFVKGMRAADWVLGFQLLKYGDVAYRNEVLCAIRFHERKGGEKQEYAEAHTLHYIQTAARHGYVIEDQALLDALGLSRNEAVYYRNKELLGFEITLTRKYHKHVVDKETVNKIFKEFKKNGSGFNFNFLNRFYRYKPALLYTYVLGVYGRIRKKISPKHKL
jgi:glycosyltransferase involved in cell wall biosynthesis